MRATAHALQIIHWQENLSREDMPPRWMWHLDEALEDHFRDVDARRARPRNATDEEPEQYANEYARGL